MARISVLFAASLAGILGVKPLHAAPPDDIAQQFFSKHCKDCHEGAKPKGDLVLRSIATNFSEKETRELWVDVLEQITEGTMPPAKEPRPPAQDIKDMAAWINGRLAEAEAALHATEGRVVMRRLNQKEYANTVRDLLGVEVELQDLLPPDASTSGFDNSAETLHVSSYLMESYLDAADRVLDEAIVNGGRPRTLKKRYDIKDESTVKPTGSVYRHTKDGVAIFSSWVSANIQVTLWKFQTPQRGRYRFRISGYGYQTQSPVTFYVKSGPPNAEAQQRLIDYFEVPAGKPTVVEFVEQMEGQQTIRIITDKLGELPRALPPLIEKTGAENYKGPGLVVQWVDVEGPLMDAWPPQSHRRIFRTLPRVPVDRDRSEVTSKQPLVDAERILRVFTRRAFRRSVTDEDIKPFLRRVRMKLADNYSFEQAMRIGLKSVMVSPRFLFLQEKAVDHGQPAPLDDFALASRLSYFLWSSMPDEPLFALAETNRLHRPDVLRQQVERMLRDPRAAAFTENFAGQWLGLRTIDATTPDGKLYPEYDDLLRQAIIKEPLLFFKEVLDNDLSLTRFVDSDFTMLSERLAEHYDIPGVRGLAFRKVTLPPESHRGGVLTMAAVLKVSANGTTTSPVIRGAWVLDRILGTPPAKPPKNVPAVEPDIRGATTIREQLAKHRSTVACAMCHTKIDPPGFALENFNVIGGWRTNYRLVPIGAGERRVIKDRVVRYRDGPPVDAADVMPDGRRFRNIDEYKQILLADKDQLARSLTDKLLAYATGAAPGAADRLEIERIVARIGGKDYGLRALVHEVVQSETFRHK